MPSSPKFKPLHGTRLLSLALNLPGPAALQRLRAMGARCTRVLPPSGDTMAQYYPQAQQQLGQGIRRTTLDLKVATGQRRLHALLSRTDVLLTSFRPVALRRLGLDADSLRARYPALCTVDIVGAPGTRADEPGHDLSYQAEAGLVPGLKMPVSLLADMAGALLASGHAGYRIYPCLDGRVALAALEPHFLPLHVLPAG